MPNTEQSRKKASAVKEAKRRKEMARRDFMIAADYHRAVARMGVRYDAILPKEQALVACNVRLGDAINLCRAVTNARSGEEAWALLEEGTDAS